LSNCWDQPECHNGVIKVKEGQVTEQSDVADIDNRIRELQGRIEEVSHSERVKLEEELDELKKQRDDLRSLGELPRTTPAEEELRLQAEQAVSDLRGDIA
jgi:TolA-binding protein